MFEPELDLGYYDDVDPYEYLEEDPLNDYYYKLSYKNVNEKIVTSTIPEIRIENEYKINIKNFFNSKKYTSWDLILYDFEEIDREYQETIEKIKNNLNFGEVHNCLIEELDPPRYYCDGNTYTNVNDIHWNPQIQLYYEKLCNMKFSDGEYLNLTNNNFFAKMCFAFQCHLDNLKDSYIEYRGMNLNKGEVFEAKIEMEYRNSDRYKKRSVARTYALMNAIKELPEDKQKVTLVTFTTYQRDSEGKSLDYRKQYSNLQTNTAKLHDLIRKDYPKVPYMHIIESHESGYIHIHRVYGCSIDRAHQEKYKRLWEKYNAGSYEYGLNFSYSDDDPYYETHQKNENYTNVDQAFLYTIKYISKTLTSKGTAPFHQFVSDALIWWVSKRKNRQYKGIRSFYISPVWNALIREKFQKKESVCITLYVAFHYVDIEKIIFDSTVVDWINPEAYTSSSSDFSPPVV
jgi:hypothetical protein